jgi:hypothetical protein
MTSIPTLISTKKLKKIKKQTSELNCDQMDLTDMYKVFHPINEEYTFFSATHGTLSKIILLGHIPSLNEYNILK